MRRGQFGEAGAQQGQISRSTSSRRRPESGRDARPRRGARRSPLAAVGRARPARARCRRWCPRRPSASRRSCCRSSRRGCSGCAWTGRGRRSGRAGAAASRRRSRTTPGCTTRRARLRVERHDPVHVAGEVEHDAGARWPARRWRCRRRARTTGTPCVAADGERRGHVLRVARRDDAERHPPVVGGVHGDQRPRCGVELDLAAGYGLPQCSGQVTRLRLRHLLLLLVPVLRPARTRRGVPRCIACLCHGSSVHADRPRTAPPRGRAAAARHGAPNIRTGPASSVRRPRSAACPRAVRLFGAGMYTRCMDCTRSVSGRLPVTSHGLCPVVPRDVAHGSHAADAGPRARKNGCRALHGHG